MRKYGWPLTMVTVSVSRRPVPGRSTTVTTVNGAAGEPLPATPLWLTSA